MAAIPAPLPGRVAFFVRFRWLAPPANFRDPSGVENGAATIFSEPAHGLAHCRTIGQAQPIPTMLKLHSLLIVLAASLLPGAFAQETPPLRAGMIGLDTSHVPAFTGIFNGPKAEGDVAGIKVVAGYPGGTDMPASRDRVQKFTEAIRAKGVEIVESIPQLLAKVDVVMLESVDGRIHLQEAIPVIKAGKPLWIDKPAAGSLAEAIAIYELARKQNVPVFSSSSLRFGEIQELRKSAEVGSIVGASTWGPCSPSPGIPDLFFYGIHGVEPLFVLMGMGCQTVTRATSKDTDFVTGVWKDGRVGTYRGLHKGKTTFGATIYGTNAIAQLGKAGDYQDLCREIARFFKTRQAPVPPEETLEVLAFMEAADESKRQGGAPVALADVLAKGKAEAAKLQQ
jgi:predicted dehydrogenase